MQPDPTSRGTANIFYRQMPKTELVHRKERRWLRVHMKPFWINHFKASHSVSEHNYIALNSAHVFFLFQLQIPSTVMFSCLFEMLLCMVTEKAALLWIFINDLSSQNKRIIHRLWKVWPLDCCIQFSIIQKCYKTKQIKEEI